MTDEHTSLALSQEFVEALAAAVKQFGEPTMSRVFTTFMVPLIPMMAMALVARDIATAAAENQLTPEQAQDAMRLAGQLRRADDPHQAWLAVEGLKRAIPKEGLDTVWMALSATASVN